MFIIVNGIGNKKTTTITLYFTYYTTKKYDNTLLIDTTLSITSIYAFFHPISPKPTRYKQFLFTMICEENLIRSRTFFR